MEGKTAVPCAWSWLVLGRRLEAGMDPLLGPVGPDLFLPDRDDFLEGVDQPAARLERLLAVRAAHGDNHADVSEVEMTDAVDQRHVDDRPAAAGFGLQLGHFLLGHAGIRLVLERRGPALTRQLAHRPEERANRTRQVRADPLGQGRMVDRSFSDLDHGTRLAGRPPLTGGIAATSAPGGISR